jgi:hypothetical protein
VWLRVTDRHSSLAAVLAPPSLRTQPARLCASPCLVCLPAAYWVATNVSEVEYETAVKRAGKANGGQPCC